MTNNGHSDPEDPSSTNDHSSDAFRHEQFLHRTNEKRMRQLRWLQLAGYAASAAIVILGAAVSLSRTLYQGGLLLAVGLFFFLLARAIGKR